MSIRPSGGRAVSRSLLRLALALMAAGACVTVSAASPTPAHLAVTPAQAGALGIVTVPIGARRALPIDGLAGTVVVPPAQQRVVAAPVAGLLERVAVAVNDPVRAGQPIARLLSPALAEMQRAFVQASVQARLADDTARRDRQLADEGLVADSRLRATLAQQAEARAMLAERRQALRLAGMTEAAVTGLEAGRAADATVELASPIDGVVLEQPVPVGSRVEAATMLFRVARIPPLWLELQVPLPTLARIAPGDAVEVPAAGARGRVLSIGRGAGAGPFVTVRALVSEGTAKLVPGQAVEATVSAVGRDTGGWQVPADAVVRHAGRTWVFVAASGGFDPLPVRVLDEGDAGTLVDGPLKAGAQVAVRGTAGLKARLAGFGGE